MTHRVFVAIDLPVPVRSQVETLQQQLERLRLPIRWELSHQIHLTLAFLGRLTDEKVSQTMRIVGRITSSCLSFFLQPVTLETLYQRHEPSLVYLLVADRDGELVSLQKKLSAALDEITPQPRRKFLPHLTIGRVRKSDPTFVKRSLDKLSQVEVEPISQFEVDRVHIYESFLSKSGSSHQRLAGFNLGKRL